ncbi:MAG TPA: hypothetical protein HPP80_02100 [Rhodospirillaceae bacterium]|nr:hypothetical protein [Rhodospirillaceae bacterium]
MNEREMYDEINALLGAVGKALDLSAEAAAKAIESGLITMEMREDARGQRFVGVTYQGKTAEIFQGAIRHQTAPEAPDPGLAEAPAVKSCGCG